MFGGHFYHEKTKKAVALFGRLFNNIYVIRKNSSGAVISQIKVPLSYAPKQKYLERVRENPDLNDDSFALQETGRNAQEKNTSSTTVYELDINWATGCSKV